MQFGPIWTKHTQAARYSHRPLSNGTPKPAKTTVSSALAIGGERTSPTSDSASFVIAHENGRVEQCSLSALLRRRNVITS
jgi:hypothetical protein